MKQYLIFGLIVLLGVFGYYSYVYQKRADADRKNIDLSQTYNIEYVYSLASKKSPSNPFTGQLNATTKDSLQNLSKYIITSIESMKNSFNDDNNIYNYKVYNVVNTYYSENNIYTDKGLDSLNKGLSASLNPLFIKDKKYKDSIDRKEIEDRKSLMYELFVKFLDLDVE